jgi:hypothetical protein
MAAEPLNIFSVVVTIRYKSVRLGTPLCGSVMHHGNDPPKNSRHDAFLGYISPSHSFSPLFHKDVRCPTAISTLIPAFAKYARENAINRTHVQRRIERGIEFDRGNTAHDVGVGLKICSKIMTASADNTSPE